MNEHVVTEVFPNDENGDDERSKNLFYLAYLLSQILS